MRHEHHSLLFPFPFLIPPQLPQVLGPSPNTWQKPKQRDLTNWAKSITEELLEDSYRLENSGTLESYELQVFPLVAVYCACPPLL